MIGKTFAYFVNLPRFLTGINRGLLLRSLLFILLLSSCAATSHVHSPQPRIISNGVQILNQTASSIDVTVSFEHEVPIKFYIADSSGHQVRLMTDGTFNPGSIHFHIQSSNFSSGNYSFVLETEGKSWKAPFTVTK